MWIPATSKTVPPVHSTRSLEVDANPNDMLGFKSAAVHRRALELIARVVQGNNDQANNNTSSSGLTTGKIVGVIIAVVVFVLLIALRCCCAGRELKKKRREVAGGAAHNDSEVKQLLSEDQKKQLYGGGALWRQFWKGSGYSKTTVGVGPVDFKTWEVSSRIRRLLLSFRTPC